MLRSIATPFSMISTPRHLVVTGAAVFIFATMMLTAGMVMAVVRTLNIRIIVQFVSKVCGDCFVGRA